MPNAFDDDWSPADNPYAIAVSESQWWLKAVLLAVARLKDADDQRSAPFSSRQIDARNLVLALAQMLTAESLEQAALEEVDVDQSVGIALAAARERFVLALPGIQEFRNALTHFDRWARGEGRGPQRVLVRGGRNKRDVAREFWGFRYDVVNRTVGLGPYTFALDAASESARQLTWAIYSAAQAIDQSKTGVADAQQD